MRYIEDRTQIIQIQTYTAYKTQRRAHRNTLEIIAHTTTVKQRYSISTQINCTSFLKRNFYPITTNKH